MVLGLVCICISTSQALLSSVLSYCGYKSSNRQHLILEQRMLCRVGLIFFHCSNFYFTGFVELRRWYCVRSTNKNATFQNCIKRQVSSFKFIETSFLVQYFFYNRWWFARQKAKPNNEWTFSTLYCRKDSCCCLFPPTPQIVFTFQLLI